ncbi:MAG: sugar phosphate isomerase/epimerase [Verrucomicrobiales bacterium]
MKPTGIGDEAGSPLETQIRATQALGWDSIELRNIQAGPFPNGNFHEISDEAFDLAAGMLADAGIGASGVGSAIGNWAHSVQDDFQITLDEIGRCIPRMQRLGCRIVRIMSYAIVQDGGSDAPEQFAAERFRRVREIRDRFESAGITPVHENCMNYGGMGIRYALELLENVPGLKWVFDTGNPVFNRDRDQPKPHPMQDAWAFYEAVRDQIIHVHVKDGIWHEDRNEMQYTMPGDGDGRVLDILRDLHQRGYQGYISIEPHLDVVFHDTGGEGEAGDPEAKAKIQFDNYVEYGRRLESLIARSKA